MAADKWQVVSAPDKTKTYRIAGAQGKTKGAPEVQNNILVFPFDSYSATEEQLFIYAAPMVRVTASGASADIAAVNFIAGQQVFWDNTNAKVTNVGAGNRPIGYALESKDLSGGVAAGATLLFELKPDAPLKILAGEVVLDGANPTSVTTGLTTILSAQATLKAAVTPGDDPSWLTVDYGGAVPAGRLDVYAWKNTGGTDPTLVASTNNTAVVAWQAVGF